MTLAEQIFEKLKNAPPSVAQEVLDFVGFLEARHRFGSDAEQTLDSFAGALKNSPCFEGAPLDLQHSMRDGWHSGRN